MIGHIIVYLLLALVLFVLNVINTSYVPFLLDVIFAFITIIALVMVIILKVGVKIRFEEENSVSERTQKYPVRLIIENKTFIPLTRCKIIVQIISGSSKKVRKIKIKSFCAARTNETCEFWVDCPDCEIVSMKIKKAYIYDIFNIFCIWSRFNSANMLIVMPHLPDLDVMGKMAYVINNEESMVYSDKKPGDDPTEIFAIRGYNGGDKIRNIHWKLSSKKDNLMVKDYSLPLREDDTVVIDIFKQNKDAVDNRNELFDLFYGLVYALTKRGYGFNACFYKDGYRTMRIETQNDIYYLFAQIYSITPYDKGIDCAACLYFSEFSVRKKRVFYVTGELDENATGQMRLLNETGTVYYLIPGYVHDSYMPVKFEG